MLGRGAADLPLDPYQLGMRRRQVDLRLRLRRADVARDVQVEIVGRDRLHRHALRIPLRLPAELVRLEDVRHVLFPQPVLPLALLEPLGRVGVASSGVGTSLMEVSSDRIKTCAIRACSSLGSDNTRKSDSP